MPAKKQEHDLSTLTAEQAISIASTGTPLSAFLPPEDEKNLLKQSLQDKDPKAQGALSELYGYGYRLTKDYPLCSLKNALWLAQQSADQGYVPGELTAIFLKIRERAPKLEIPTIAEIEQVKAISDQGYYKATFRYGSWLLDGKTPHQDTREGLQMWLKSLKEVKKEPLDTQKKFVSSLIAIMSLRVGLYEEKDHTSVKAFPASTFYPVLDALLKDPDVTDILSKDSRHRGKFEELIGKTIAETRATFPKACHG